MIVGLGNPGTHYRLTRHNLGFLVLDLLAARYRIDWRERKQLALIGTGLLSGQQFLLVKPQTFMNNSGEAVALLARKAGLSEESLLVVHDDLDLPFGGLKIKRGGGAGGHKGMASILSRTGMEDFARVKLGIGRPDALQSPEAYVLNPFSREQQETLGDFLQRGADAVTCILEEGVARAMNRFNKRGDRGLPVDQGAEGQD